MMNDLKGFTTKNYEADRSYTYDNGKYTFTNHDGNLGDPEIKYVPSRISKIDGFIHSHYDGILKIFSPSDLMVPYNWFMNKNGINNLNTFSLGLVTSGGTYFLFITDVQKYMAFGKAYGADAGQDLLSIYYKEYGITEDTSDADSLRILVGLLDKWNTGLTLLKNAGDNKYGVVTKDRNGNVKIINCN